ncbi:MAG TPA: type II CAAX endopeptidase family protein [Coriobacteriia bacterium]|nr:type II CAAX endopeptidase family protein [Coriobacteriia bacterium]
MRTNDARGMTVRTLWPFFGMAFGLSWGLAALAIFFQPQLEPIFGPIGYTNPLFIIAVYAPGLSGIFLVIKHYGLGGFRSYLKRLTLWRMPSAWAVYLILGIPAAFYLAAAIKGASLAFPFTPWYTVVPALLIGLAIGPMEEFGWRGVALPLLQRKFRPIVADLILSVLWAVWHVPAFFMSGTPQSNWSFPAFFVGVISISFILTPLFNAARGSILIAALYHFQMNNPIWPDAQPWDSLVFAIIALAVIVLNRKAMFTKACGVTDVLMPGDEERFARRPSTETKPALGGTPSTDARPASVLRNT